MKKSPIGKQDADVFPSKLSPAEAAHVDPTETGKPAKARKPEIKEKNDPVKEVEPTTLAPAEAAPKVKPVDAALIEGETPIHFPQETTPVEALVADPKTGEPREEKKPEIPLTSSEAMAKHLKETNWGQF